MSGSGGLRRGDVVRGVVEKGVYRGRGLFRLDGRVLLVPRAFPGDSVRVEVTDVHAGWAQARLVEVEGPSPDRRASPCPYVPRCGGCAYQELAYPAQVRLKEAVLRESLRRVGVPWKGDVEVHASLESGWRVRASLHFAPGADGPRLGLREEGSRRLVDVDGCLQLSGRMGTAARAVRAALAGRPSVSRGLRGLDLLEAPDGSTLVACLATALPAREAQSLAALAPGLPLDGFGVSAERRLLWLRGSPFVEATVLGLRLRAHVRSFFQANRFLLEPLAREVTGLVERGRGPVLDLYAGVGLFAMPLGARGEDVVAVEWSSSAAEDARWAIRENGLRRVRVLEGDVARRLGDVPPAPGERVVLDPPRTGVGPEVVSAVAARRPEAVVYVSCDPATLGRDLASFAAKGYRPDAVLLFDLFPDTFHLEAVVRLRAS